MCDMCEKIFHQGCSNEFSESPTDFYLCSKCQNEFEPFFVTYHQNNNDYVVIMLHPPDKQGKFTALNCKYVERTGMEEESENGNEIVITNEQLNLPMKYVKGKIRVFGNSIEGITYQYKIATHFYDTKTKTTYPLFVSNPKSDVKNNAKEIFMTIITDVILFY